MYFFFFLKKLSLSDMLFILLTAFTTTRCIFSHYYKVNLLREMVLSTSVYAGQWIGLGHFCRT